MNYFSLNRFYRIYFFLTFLFLISACEEKKEAAVNNVNPPVAEKIPVELTSHNQKRIDNYFWMRLSDEQKMAAKKDDQTQKVLAYLNAENDYLKEKMKHTEDLQKNLYEEMKNRMPKDDASVPYKENGYWYYTRFEEGKDYPIHCRKKGTMEAPEEVLLNVNEMAKDYSYYNVADFSVSDDNKLLLFGVDTLSRRQYTIYVKDLTSGKIVDTSIPFTNGAGVWANDNKTFFYMKLDPITLRSDKVYKHTLGEDASQDKMVFHEDDVTFYTFVYKTKSNKYIVIGSQSTLTNYYKILDANSPNGSFKEFSPREKGVKYEIEHFEDKFYILTNLNALNFRLMETPENKTEQKNWKDKIPHRGNVLLENMEVFKNYLVLSERSNALLKLRVINQSNNEEHYVNFEEPAYSLYSSENHDFDTDALRFGYTSLVTPTSTYEYDMGKRAKNLLKRQEVVGNYNPDNYTTERVFATAEDGMKIPISIVYKKGIKKDGNNPALITGYGSYGYSNDPYFSYSRISLLDRGFVFAVAHIRGGQEMSRSWYEDGKMFKKKNTFTDFIRCSEFLIENKYTSSDKLFAQGGSAGGLLMGAVINMRPDLYKGVIAKVPFVDVISTMEDESIPLTTFEFDEWGNPKNKDSFDYMMSYSPYDQVKAQDYPHLLVTTGLFDSQVQYWEPAKWVAKLRAHKTDDNLLLLRTNMETGHGGASGRFKHLEEIAVDYAFLLNLANIKN